MSRARFDFAYWKLDEGGEVSGEVTFKSNVDKTSRDIILSQIYVQLMAFRVRLCEGLILFTE